MQAADDRAVPDPAGGSSERQFRILIAVALVLLGAVAYVNTFGGGWVWDDVSSVLLHEHVQQPGQFFQLFREDQHAFGKGEGNFYRPLVAATFMLDFQLAYNPLYDAPVGSRLPELKPLLFHISNLLWHVAAALLLFALLTRLGAPRFVRAAAALIFVVHPLHTEAVAYISGRADMMSAAFMFAALFFALTPSTGRRRTAAHAGSAVCFAAALLSKESSLIYPVLLAVLICFRADPVTAQLPGALQRLRLRAVPVAVAGALLVVYVALRATVLSFAPMEATAAPAFGTRLVQTGQAFASYIQKLFVPTGLHMEQTLAGVPAWTALIGALLLALCIAIVVFAFRRGQYRVAAGMAWFLAAWLPISGLFPLNAPMAEHWMYVPMAGFWWALGELLYRAVHRARPTAETAPSAMAATEGRTPFALPAAIALVYALVLLFTFLTVQRNLDWGDNVRLFRSTLAHSPESFRVHYNLAVTHESITENLPGARRHFEHILGVYQEQKRRQSPTGATDYLLEDEIGVRLSLGQIALELGEYTEALNHFAPLAALDPETYGEVVAEALISIGRALIAQGEYNGANYYLSEAVRLYPPLAPEATALLTDGLPPAPIS